MYHYCRLLKRSSIWRQPLKQSISGQAAKLEEKIIDGMKTYTEKQIKEALIEAGFSGVRCDHHTSHPWLTMVAEK